MGIIIRLGVHRRPAYGLRCRGNNNKSRRTPRPAYGLRCRGNNNKSRRTPRPAYGLRCRGNNNSSRTPYAGTPAYGVVGIIIVVHHTPRPVSLPTVYRGNNILVIVSRMHPPPPFHKK